MVSASVQNAINKQVQFELESAYLYLAMSAYCEHKSLPGTASWLRAQWQEEIGHAMKLCAHVVDRDGRVVFEALAKPQADFGTPAEMFKLVLSHEQKVTAAINALYDLAGKENDHAAQIALQWFVNEQVEEEKHASDVLHMFTAAGDNPVSLIMIDRQLGERAAK